MNKEEIDYKDLSKKQLDNLKEIYIESRLNSMSEEDLRHFVKEIIQGHVGGTFGNQEDIEVWKEMKEHFEEDFHSKLQFVIKDSGGEEVSVEQKEFARRLANSHKRVYSR